jgi:hypothetical protein
MKNKLSEYYSDDKNNKAVVIEHEGRYFIDFYENNSYNHTIMYNDKTLRYVEDAAENYALGIFKNIKDFK